MIFHMSHIIHCSSFAFGEKGKGVTGCFASSQQFIKLLLYFCSRLGNYFLPDPVIRLS